MFQKITKLSLPLLKLTLDHPFNKLLLQRQLPTEVFEFYLAQDKFYLKELAKLLPKISTRLTLPQHKLIFDQFTKDTVEAEQNMRANFNTENPLTISSVILNYLKHLEESAQHPDLAVAIAAFMPCFWLYKQIGESVDLKQTEDNHCKQSRWLKLYVDPGFHKATDQAIDIMLAQVDATDEESVIRNMAEVFRFSAQCELDFWDRCIQDSTLFPTAISQKTPCTHGYSASKR